MRKLASIQKIHAVEPIQDADAIEVCTIGGWKVVAKKNEFAAGDICVYIEIDSWVPTTIAPFLSKGREPRVYNGVKGERLRTVKLRGQISQGLLLPLETIFPLASGMPVEGLDVTKILGIQKYEPPIPVQLGGKVIGVFPSYIPKTDQERIQNLTDELLTYIIYYWEITEKLDGSSMTVYVNNEKSGVCSRNYDLDMDENNSFWAVAIKKQLIQKIKDTGRNLAFQGELIGPGIQKNRYNIPTLDFYLFDVYDIDRECYLRPNERYKLATDLNINHVPIINEAEKIANNINTLLIQAEGKSRLNKNVEREGLVFKSISSNESFKAISNKFLLKDE